MVTDIPNLSNYGMREFMRDLTEAREGMTRPVAFNAAAEKRAVETYRAEAARRKAQAV